MLGIDWQLYEQARQNMERSSPYPRHTGWSLVIMTVFATAAVVSLFLANAGLPASAFDLSLAVTCAMTGGAAWLWGRAQINRYHKRIDEEYERLRREVQGQQTPYASG